MSWHDLLNIVKALALPPMSLIVLGFLGLWLRQRRARLGNIVIATALGLLYILSTPLFSGIALGSLEPRFVDPMLRSDAQAIVVLAGGSSGLAPEYGVETVSRLTLVRVRYAAKLQRLTAKPLLVSGTAAESEQMHAVLSDEFRVPVRWVENLSRDTFTNALGSYRILAPHGVKTIYLITHAWHMPRARLAFEHAGFTVIPAPTGFSRGDEIDFSALDLIPRASSLLNSYYFFHEVLGYLAYALRARL